MCLGRKRKSGQQKDKEIMSGEELIQFLQDNEEYDFDKIEQIFPAYEMVSVSEEQDPLVKLVPTWCIKINGTVKPVSKKDSAVKEGIEMEWNRTKQSSLSSSSSLISFGLSIL
ncbi:two-component system activity regulator YycH [Bacillus licheniformis]|nr:two-component system activity regulator YycH [Bacillus licheniformis]